ncbi:MAG TPA: hypothetical protein ENJ44_07735 [Oceanospirillales bacterium]|nr:hypothetical protein [Oceanospirillales bacterium]
MYKSFALLFKKEPTSWGLRGDPYLWQAMSDYLAIKPLPNTAKELISILEDSFFYLTQHHISETEFFKIEKFSHGGMSSGVISPKYWREKIIPHILKHYKKLP